MKQQASKETAHGLRFRCPYCGCYTMERPSGHYAICAVCFWEDDNIQLGDPTYAGGANKLSLEQSCRNFQAFGAKEKRFKRYVRQPRPDELPPPPGE